MRDWLSHRAGATPGSTAVIDTATEQRRSFADLDRAVDRTASYLAALDVDDGDHVGIVVEDRMETIRLLWATMRIGAVSVLLRPEWDAEALSGHAEETDLTAVVCGDATESTATAIADTPIVTIDDPESDDVERLSDRESISIAPSTWTRSDPATIVFTAGTTGDPRPVVLEMGNHLTNATDAAFRFGMLPTDRWLSCQPIHHVNGLATVFRATLFGGTIVLQEESTPGPLADTLDAHDVTCLTASPSTVSKMLEARGMLTDSLRAVVVTSAPVPPALLDRCRGYSIPAFAAYSLTEAAGLVTAVGPGTGEASGSVGTPLFRMEVTVVDTDGTPASQGQTGELVVSGPSVTPGYYDSDVGGPAGRNGHGVATGDIGFREDGRIHVLSRRADRILVGGETVRAADVRDVVCEHEGVADAAVVGVPDTEWGERPGVLVVRSDPDLDAETLQDHCQARLATFVVPEQFTFTTELPRTPSGDVDRRAVRKHLLDREHTDSAESVRSDGQSSPDASSDEQSSNVNSEQQSSTDVNSGEHDDA